MVEADIEQEAWQDYTANILCMIARPQYESEIPMYTKLAGHEKPENEMTSEEIFDNIMNKLDELAMKGV